MAAQIPQFNRPRDRRFLVAVGALFCVTFLQVTVVSAASPPQQPLPIEPQNEQQARILFPTPPNVSSRRHRELAEAAGPHTVSDLEMTGGQVWSLQGDRLQQTLTVARRLKVPAERIAPEPSMALAGMAAGARMTASEKSMMSQSMRQPGSMGMMMAQTPNAAMTEFALTATDAAGSPAAVRLALTDGLTVEATRQRLEKTDDGYIWHGVISGSDDPVTLLWWPSGRLTGQVTYRDRMYVVIEVSPRDMPPEHAPMPPAMMKKMKMDRDPLVHEGSAESLHATMRTKPAKVEQRAGGTPAVAPAKPGLPDTDTSVAPRADLSRSQDPIELTLMVAYTRKAAKAYTDIRSDLIALAVEEANQSFIRSGIGHIKLRLVHAYQTDYRESGTHFDHVFRFADAGDGVMEEVSRLRQRYKADIAVLIVDDANGCGLSAGIAPAAERAFAVVHHYCAATSYSLAHEIGHILGARHDRALDDGTTPFSYGHGYIHGREWRTMMSYEESCGKCPRLPIWSSPSLIVRGVPAGDADTDNARVIAERAAIVGSFR
jgi:hypothetical protein